MGRCGGSVMSVRRVRVGEGEVLVSMCERVLVEG